MQNGMSWRVSVPALLVAILAVLVNQAWTSRRILESNIESIRIQRSVVEELGAANEALIAIKGFDEQVMNNAYQLYLDTGGRR